ncbi:hypothetical protein JD844_014734 [Phrynosoma platyrhinos]|uniref:Sperm equatorial segment protein 1 n=1 Tax=Phrynosoma platyrhinos TaxID=52577 RepID=A0ABQ7SS23_PHRPL|nr:hypothetical protein JD844_014734 [Phrynosoma platyrhinos]
MAVAASASSSSPPLLLLLWALSGFLPRLGSAPVPSVQHTYESVKHLQISVQPTAVVQISGEKSGNQSKISALPFRYDIFENSYCKSFLKVFFKEANSPKSAGLSSTEEEEKTLNDLVGLLQDVVKNIPTEQTQLPAQSQTAVVSISHIEPSPSESVDTVWKSVKPKKEEIKEEASETDVLATERPQTTTAFWQLRSDATASVVLHADKDTAENTTLGSHQREISASVAFYSATPATPTPEKPLVSVSLLLENNTTPAANAKSFDQLTNGALANLVESLKNVKKLHLKLHKSTSQPQQESNKEKSVEAPQHKPSGTDILNLIDTLIKTIKNAPSAVKEDPALHNYIDKAEGFLKEALELAAEAENKLAKAMKQEKGNETAVEVVVSPSPPATAPVSVVSIHLPPSPTESLEKKAKETQVEMGKLKAFINLLYGFSPQLTSYAQNSPNKKGAEDIIDRTMAVLGAIKSVFCGNSEGQSKQMLKQLLEKDMELVKQAMKEVV